MKRVFGLGLLFVMIAACAGCGTTPVEPTEDTAVSSETAPAEDISFTYVNRPDGTIAVTSYQASEQPEVVEIPSEIDGKTVAEISGFMFMQEEHVKKVILPETLREIDNSTFLNATSIEEVVITGPLDMIGEAAFSGCSSLVNLDFRKGLKEIGYVAINLCENLEDVYLPEDLESTDDVAICILCDKVTIHVPKGSQTETLIREMQKGSDFTGTILAE